MEKLINKILLICALLGAAFTAYAYVTEKPSNLIEQQRKDLEAKIEKAESSIRIEMKERREARDREMLEIKGQVASAKSEIMQKLDVIDARLYELQKRTPSNRSASIKADEDDGG